MGCRDLTTFYANIIPATNLSRCVFDDIFWNVEIISDTPSFFFSLGRVCVCAHDGDCGGDGGVCQISKARVPGIKGMRPTLSNCQECTNT